MTMKRVVQRQPLYLQVKDILLSRLTSGEWKPGERLPAEPVLAAETGVSVGTLRRAVELLVSDGVLTRREGVGTKVRTFQTEGYWNRFQPLVRLDGTPRFDERRLISFNYVPAPEAVAPPLQLTAGTPVIRMVRHLIKRKGGNEFLDIIEEDYLNPRFFPQFTEARLLLRFRPDDSLYKFYDREFGVVVTHQKCAVGTERMNGALARSLSLPEEDVEIRLKLVRTSYTYAHVPVEYRITRTTLEGLQVVFDLQ